MIQRVLSRIGLVTILSVMLCACGGGGGGGGGSSSNNVQLDPGSITFRYNIDDTWPAAQIVTVTFSGDGLIAGPPAGSSIPDWLNFYLADSSDETSPVDVELIAYPEGLSPGTYQTTLRFVTGNTDGSDIHYTDMPVTFIITNALSLDKTELNFIHTEGAAAAPDDQTVAISGDSVVWSAAADETWVVMDIASGSTPDTLSIGVAPDGLAQGSHTATVTVTNTVNNESETITVNLAVEPHQLFVGDNGVAFSSFPTAESRLTHTVKVTENAGAAATWSASSDKAWLTVTPNGQTDGDLTLSADPSGLAADAIHEATVTITSGAATIAGSETVKVGLYVSSADPSVTSLAYDVDNINGAYVAADPLRPYVYATNAGTTVDVYNIYNGTKVDTVTAGSKLKAMAVSSDGATLFVIDAEDHTIVPVEIATMTAGSKWPADDFSSGFAKLDFVRFVGKDVVMTHRREVFDAGNGELLTTIPSTYFDNMIMGASLDGESFFATQPGASGAGELFRFTGHYSSASDMFSIEQTHQLNITLANPEEIAVNKDGSAIFFANGGDAGFRRFDFDGNQITEGTMLTAGSYPKSVDIGPTGKVCGGIYTSLGGPDIWCYNTNGTDDGSHTVSGSLYDGQLSISGDGLRVIAPTSAFRLTFTAVTP